MASDFCFGSDISNMQAAIDAANYSEMIQLGIPVGNPEVAKRLFGVDRVIDPEKSNNMITSLKQIYEILKLFKKK